MKMINDMDRCYASLNRIDNRPAWMKAEGITLNYSEEHKCLHFKNIFKLFK